MRVICIDGFTPENPDVPTPEEGKIYTTLDDKNFEGHHMYQIEELLDRLGRACWYISRRFIPTSNINEDEFVDEILEKMFCPVNIDDCDLSYNSQI